jgi:lipopolysaccharide cholinephosphotransferase
MIGKCNIFRSNLRKILKHCLIKLNPAYRKLFYLEAILNTFNIKIDVIHEKLENTNERIGKQISGVHEKLDKINRKIEVTLANEVPEKILYDIRGHIWGAEDVTKNWILKHLNVIYDARDAKPAVGDLRTIQLFLGWHLSEFKRICDENDIKYWLCYGTLLGAVRHHDFVPWDDDLDVSMDISEYTKLLKVINNYSEFEIKDFYYVDGGGFCKIPKFIMKNYSIPVFVDIWVYYDIDCRSPDDEDRLWKEHLERRLRLCQDISRLNMNYNDEYLIPEKDLRRMNHLFDPYITEYRDRCGFDYTIIGVESLQSPRKKIFRKNFIYPLEKVVFQGIDYNRPRNTDEYLSQIYGNYFEFPFEVSSFHPQIPKEYIRKMKEFLKLKNNL